MDAAAQLATLGLSPGTRIAKKYRIEKLIAIGGMGAVVKAHHEVLDQAVAIKVMKPELAQQEDAPRRFLREARAAARIESECVARVTDVDLLKNGSPYMVMEYLEGKDLLSVLQEPGELPISDAVDYALQALEGVDSAHALGIIHRDLKPSNLFLTKTRKGHPRVKVLDFGISKIVEEGSSSPGLLAGAITTTQSLVGTPRYMSPEQISAARTVDHRTDIWAIGLILYELLTKQYPFEGENPGEVLAAILMSPPDDVGGLRDSVPPELAAAIHRSLEKKRDDRFEDARRFLRAIAPFGSARIHNVVLEPGELTGAHAEKPQSAVGTKLQSDANAAPVTGDDETLAASAEPKPERDDETLQEDLGPPSATPEDASSDAAEDTSQAERALLDRGIRDATANAAVTAMDIPMGSHGGKNMLAVAGLIAVPLVVAAGWYLLATDTPAITDPAPSTAANHSAPAAPATVVATTTSEALASVSPEPPIAGPGASAAPPSPSSEPSAAAQAAAPTPAKAPPTKRVQPPTPRQPPVAKPAPLDPLLDERK